MTTPAVIFDLAGRVIWVTGSSRGIGRGVAIHLANNNASVVVHGRHPERLSLEEVGAASAVVGDVRQPETVSAMVDEIHRRHGRLDAVVANVGAAHWGPAAALTPEQWRNSLAVNLDSAFFVAQKSYPLLADTGGGIVFISATAASSPTPNFAGYGAAKAAVEHLTRTLAAEWAPQVRVNCVSPGLILTEGSSRALFAGDEDKIARAGSTTAVGRVGRVEDIAWAVHFLLSPASSYITGHVLVVDGGETEGPADRVLRVVEGRD
ncbi:MAG: putative short-chain dehydrogenase/reductase [Acidimicrobiia bacterium]|nr:MAG: putative short-chain dehydrogenase/reductase [Acidimicrobiia bacterium]